MFFYYCVAAYHKFPCNPVLMHSINYCGFSQAHHALQIVNFAWISVVCPNTIVCVIQWEWFASLKTCVIRKDTRQEWALDQTVVLLWVWVKKLKYIKKRLKVIWNPVHTGLKGTNKALRFFLFCWLSEIRKPLFPHLHAQLRAICFLFKCSISHGFSKTSLALINTIPINRSTKSCLSFLLKESILVVSTWSQSSFIAVLCFH